jgi:hypothetical protein
MLQHENILPVFGYTYGFGLLMAIVHPWAENGNLTTFLEREDSALKIVRRFRIVSLPGYVNWYRLTGMPARRYLRWSTIPYVVVVPVHLT